MIRDYLIKGTSNNRVGMPPVSLLANLARDSMLLQESLDRLPRVRTVRMNEKNDGHEKNEGQKNEGQILSCALSDSRSLTMRLIVE